jgi:hypothetical protein
MSFGEWNLKLERPAAELLPQEQILNPSDLFAS